MANNANECKDLVIEDKYNQLKTEGKDPLQVMIDMQKSLQEDLYFPTAEHESYQSLKFRDFNLRQAKDFLLMNEHALVDELHEMMDALGGIKDGISSAAWKPWKKDHKKITDIKLKDLSEGDLKELKMEAIDAWHFFMNILCTLNVSAEELTNYYFSKNKENIARQERGY